jgi:hypothetical protein
MIVRMPMFYNLFNVAWLESFLFGAYPEPVQAIMNV